MRRVMDMGLSRRRGWSGATIVLFAAACAGPGQGSKVGEVQPEPRPGAPRIVEGRYVRPGTVLVARMDHGVDTDTGEEGERFTATVATPLADAAGRPIVPVGAKLRGRVDTLEQGRGAKPAAITLAVDAIAIGGAELPIRARVAALDVQQVGEQPSEQPIREGLTGGVLIGILFGVWPSVIFGGSIGAGGGAIKAVVRREVNAIVPSGSFVAVRLEAPIAVARLRRATR